MRYCDTSINNIVCIDSTVIYMEKCVTLVIHFYACSQLYKEKPPVGKAYLSVHVDLAHLDLQVASGIDKCFLCSYKPAKSGITTCHVQNNPRHRLPCTIPFVDVHLHITRKHIIDTARDPFAPRSIATPAFTVSAVACIERGGGICALRSSVRTCH